MIHQMSDLVLVQVTLCYFMMLFCCSGLIGKCSFFCVFWAFFWHFLVFLCKNHINKMIFAHKKHSTKFVGLSVYLYINYVKMRCLHVVKSIIDIPFLGMNDLFLPCSDYGMVVWVTRPPSSLSISQNRCFYV